MTFSIVITFIIGVVVGTFLGMMGVSLCFIGRRTDGMVNHDATQSDAQP